MGILTLPFGIELTTDDGVRLRGDWAPAAAERAVVVATHPHPLMGGDMTNVVPASLAADLPPRGISVLRFDFRGGGGSGGDHGGGETEVRDVAAALAWVHERGAGVPVVIAGYSFGADVAANSIDDTLAGWVLMAPPLARTAPACARDPRPVLVLAAEHDQFFAPALATERTAGWATTVVEVVPGADHFLAGRGRWLADRAATFVDERVDAADAAADGEGGLRPA